MGLRGVSEVCDNQKVLVLRQGLAKLTWTELRDSL